MTEDEMMAEIDRLTAENVRQKTTISNGDRSVTRHVERIKELEALIDPDGKPGDPLPKSPADPPGDNPANPPSTSDADDREKRLDRRERILTLSLEKGIDPATAMAILEGDDGDRLDAFQAATDDSAQAATDAILKAGGVTPGGGISLNYAPPSMDVLEGLAKNGVDVVRQFGKDAIHNAAQAAESRPTLRQRLADRIGGSK
jgi:hypothetical protein